MSFIAPCSHLAVSVALLAVVTGCDLVATDGDVGASGDVGVSGDPAFEATGNQAARPGLDAPILVAPADGSVLSEQPTFGWDVRAPGATVLVEICADPGCLVVRRSFIGRDEAGRPAVELMPGRYYWRAAQLRDHLQSPWSATFQLALTGEDHFRSIAGRPPATNRLDAAVAPLGDGRVLVVGGRGDAWLPLASAELFDPATESFAPTGSMATARYGHRATALDDGRVLVTGGESPLSADILASTEIYDPATGELAPGPAMSAPRVGHTATLLDDGRVLVAGGGNATARFLDSAEVFDPASDTFTPVGRMTVTRNRHQAIRLEDGRVLLVAGPHPNSSGGGGRNDVELFDPATDTFSATEPTAWPRNRPTVAQLPDGRVLVSGGSIGLDTTIREVEVYDPVSETFGVPVMMTVGRNSHTMTTLLDGRALAAGGASEPAAETYTPPASAFVPVAAQMLTDRGGHTATLLDDGRVLLFGRPLYSDGPVAEIFVPGWAP